MKSCIDFREPVLIMHCMKTYPQTCLEASEWFAQQADRAVYLKDKQMYRELRAMIASFGDQPVPAAILRSWTWVGFKVKAA